MEINKYDKIIIGAGLYGLYSALFCAKKGEKVLVLECEKGAFQRATYINQARVHQGYHYPRSLSTAAKSAGYFERFNKEYAFCILNEFKQIYATSSCYSWTNGEQFMQFCRAAHIPCEEVPVSRYFQVGKCDGAFLTREYTYDAKILCNYFLENLSQYAKTVKIQYGVQISNIDKTTHTYQIFTMDGHCYESNFVLNATYASTNQILNLIAKEDVQAIPFKIKYELCEIILCNANKSLMNYGFTVMDGPFFSIMPFGKTGLHSLTAVSFTPHMTSYEKLPNFNCQQGIESFCSKTHLGNCNLCIHKPRSAFPYMAALARKYILPCYEFTYAKSLFSMKPILMSSEIDDSRPTVIHTYSRNPTFVSVLSGKINTVYDLDEVLSNG